MSFLGLDAFQWFVVLDLFVLMGSTTLAAALYRHIRRREMPAPRIHRPTFEDDAR